MLSKCLPSLLLPLPHFGEHGWGPLMGDISFQGKKANGYCLTLSWHSGPQVPHPRQALCGSGDPSTSFMFPHQSVLLVLPGVGLQPPSLPPGPEQARELVQVPFIL